MANIKSFAEIHSLSELNFILILLHVLIFRMVQQILTHKIIYSLSSFLIIFIIGWGFVIKQLFCSVFMFKGLELL